MELELLLPPSYPWDSFQVAVKGPETLPELLIAHLEREIGAWLQEDMEQQKAEDRVRLAFRPFLHWLDRNLQSLFVQGLKKVRLDVQATNAGISLVLPPSAVEERAEEREDNEDDVKTEDEEEGGAEGEDDSSEVEDEQESESDDGEEGERENLAPGSGSVQDVAGKGEVELRVVGQLGGNVATIFGKVFQFVLHCARCHHRFEAKLSCSEKQSVVAVSASCERCHSGYALRLHPALLHEHSPLLGTVSLDACLPADIVLLTSELSATCLSCNKQSTLKVH